MLFCVYVRNLSSQVAPGAAPFEHWVVTDSFDQAVAQVADQIKDQKDLIVAGARLKAPIEGVSSLTLLGGSAIATL